MHGAWSRPDIWPGIRLLPFLPVWSGYLAVMLKPEWLNALLITEFRSIFDVSRSPRSFWSIYSPCRDPSVASVLFPSPFPRVSLPRSSPSLLLSFRIGHTFRLCSFGKERPPVASSLPLLTLTLVLSFPLSPRKKGKELGKKSKTNLAISINNNWARH